MTNARQWCETLTGFHNRTERDAPIPSPSALVLKHGAEWTARRPWRWRGTPKACFANAQYLARTRKLQYVEGYATGVIPCEHAWCIDGDGRVVDPTWQEDFKPDYFGIVFEPDAVRRIRQVTGRSYSLLFTWWKWREVYAELAKGGLA